MLSVHAPAAMQLSGAPVKGRASGAPGNRLAAPRSRRQRVAPCVPRAMSSVTHEASEVGVHVATWSMPGLTRGTPLSASAWTHSPWRQSPDAPPAGRRYSTETTKQRFRPELRASGLQGALHSRG